MLKSIDFWPLVPKKLSVESSINDDVYEKRVSNHPTFKIQLKPKFLLHVVAQISIL